MHKKYPNEPRKITKNHTTLMLFYVDTRKNLKAIRGNGYRFVHKGGIFPTKNHHVCCEKLRFLRSIYPNLPQMGQKNYHGMLMPLHDGFGRERPTFGDETISIASYCFQKNSRVNIEQQECCVIFCDFSGFVWTFLCINWVFNEFYVHSSNLNYMHMLQRI